MCSYTYSHFIIYFWTKMSGFNLNKWENLLQYWRYFLSIPVRARQQPAFSSFFGEVTDKSGEKLWWKINQREQNKLPERGRKEDIFYLVLKTHILICSWMKGIPDILQWNAIAPKYIRLKFYMDQSLFTYFSIIHSAEMLFHNSVLHNTLFCCIM